MENESLNEKTIDDVHTKEIDLVNRDPNHINDDVVKVSQTSRRFGGKRGIVALIRVFLSSPVCELKL